MSGKKKNEKVQDRKFWGILWIDTTDYNYKDVLKIIQEYFDEWAYIVHDKDTEEDGTPRKAHIHWMGRNRCPVSKKTIANKIGVTENWIQYVDKWKKCCNYLVHNTEDSQHKYQYLVEEVTTNFNFSKYVLADENDKQARNILDAILKDGIHSFTELAFWALDNGCYGEYIRAMPLWREVLREYDRFVTIPKEHEENKKEFEKVKKNMNAQLKKLIDANEKGM